PRSDPRVRLRESEGRARERLRHHRGEAERRPAGEGRVIDLAAAYRQLDEILARHGVARWAYEVTLTVWNHRHDGGTPFMGFTASAIGDGECIQAYQLSTLEAALEELE